MTASLLESALNGVSSRNAQFQSVNRQRMLNGHFMPEGLLAWLTGASPCVRYADSPRMSASTVFAYDG